MVSVEQGKVPNCLTQAASLVVCMLKLGANVWLSCINGSFGDTNVQNMLILVLENATFLPLNSSILSSILVHCWNDLVCYF